MTRRCWRRLFSRTCVQLRRRSLPCLPDLLWPCGQVRRHFQPLHHDLLLMSRRRSPLHLLEESRHLGSGFGKDRCRLAASRRRPPSAISSSRPWCPAHGEAAAAIRFPRNFEIQRTGVAMDLRTQNNSPIRLSRTGSRHIRLSHPVRKRGQSSGNLGDASSILLPSTRSIPRRRRHRLRPRTPLPNQIVVWSPRSSFTIRSPTPQLSPRRIPTPQHPPHRSPTPRLSWPADMVDAAERRRDNGRIVGGGRIQGATHTGKGRREGRMHWQPRSTLPCPTVAAAAVPGGGGSPRQSTRRHRATSKDGPGWAPVWPPKRWRRADRRRQ